MDKLTIAEEAYKNGYEKGLKDAVKHGRWINAQIAAHDPFGYYTKEVDVFTCSVCDVEFDVSQIGNYCLNCGAKMDGG